VLRGSIFAFSAPGRASLARLPAWLYPTIIPTERSASIAGKPACFSCAICYNRLIYD